MVQHLIAELQDKRRCRFLRFCSKKVKWVQASLQQVKAKIEHGLRDARQQLADESYPDTPSWTPQKCVPAINDLHDKRDSQRPEFVNATRHSRSESLSMSRMHMIPIQETAFTHESCARRASCKYSWYENTTTKRNTTLPESPSYSYVFDGIESDQDLTKIAELEGSTSSLSFESDDDLTEMQELERSISPMSFESDEDLTKMAEEKFKHGQGVAARLVRPNILDFQPSRCARDDISEGIFHVADENTISPTSIPTNSLDPHGQKLRLERNSDPYQFSLKEKYAAHRGHGLTPANIFAGVGSDPAIDLLMRIFCRPSVDNVLVTPPTYGIYKVCAKVNDVEIISCPLSKDLSLRVPETLEAVNTSTKLLFICSPGNAACKAIPLSDIEKVAASSRYGGLIVVDEANGDFSDERSAISLINKYPNIIVLQTLSKAFGLAGIRCGFAIAAPDVIQLMNNVNALHNGDSLTSEVASNALNAIDLLDKSISTRPSEGALV